jgi:hypothetical protein
MPSNDRRAAARRRAWGRGPMILRFEPLERRQLLAIATTNLPDLVDTAFSSTATADWGGTIEVKGTIANDGAAPVPPGALAGIYASSSNVIGAGSVLIGTVPINAGLQPGASISYDQQLTLPPSPISGMSNTSTRLWIGVRIDPGSVILEQNPYNKEGIGLGVDQSIVTITPQLPASLIGTAFSVSPVSASWGDTVTLTAQITNKAQGDAPATRAKIVLTPNGLAPGGSNDVTVGNLQIPAIPAFQTTNVVQQITLPAIPPTLLAGQGAYLISMIQDADHVTSPIVQTPKIQGLGLDTQVVSLGSGSATIKQGPLPDLAATGVVPSSTNLYWGQTFTVSTNVENIGKASAAGFNVEFLLTNVNSSTNGSIYLGSASIAGGLQAGFDQNVVQTLKLPSRLPYGYNLHSTDYGRIIAIVDPENQINESLKTNNQAGSAPIVLTLLGADGKTTVPTTPPVRSNQPLPTTVTPATPITKTNPTKSTGGTKAAVAQAAAARKAAAYAAAQARQAARQAAAAQRAAYLRAHPPKKNNNGILTQIDKYTNPFTKLFKNIF